MANHRLARDVANNLDTLWDAAYPQGDGDYVRLWTDVDREIDFSASVNAIDLKLRAFGKFECIATLNGLRYFIRRAICWVESHSHPPGTLVHVDGLHYVIACQDGFVTVLDWSLIPPGLKIDAPVR